MRRVNVDNLSDAIMEELTIFHKAIDKGFMKVIDECSEKFVKNTKADAPKGRRKKFYKHISKKNVVNKLHKYTNLWFVKDPEYRLTHLIKNGHSTRNGGRTKDNDFITQNYEEMEKKLGKEIEEVIKRGY